MAGDKGKLTREQRAEVRARWEGCDIEGFDWLAKEASAAYGVTVSRQAMAKAAAKGAWVKGGPPRGPLAFVPKPGEPVEPPKPPEQPARRTRSAVAQPVRPEQPQRLPATTTPVERVDAEAVDDAPRKHPGGRPTKYRPEFDQRIIDWFNVQATRDVEVHGFGGATKIQVLPNTPPTLVRFAEDIGVSLDTLGRWATEVDDEGRPRHPSFADAYARARQLLEGLLVEGATIGVYDSKLTQFMLKNWYGWKDQPERDVAVAPVSRELLDTLYIQRMTAARERQRQVDEERRLLRELEDKGEAT